MTTTPEENVIIIGGGPAGLAAAIYTSRANFAPMVFAGSPPGGQLLLTTEVENFPGYESIMGPELVDKMRKQALRFGTKIVDDNIVKVDFSKRPFEVYLSESASSNVYRGQSIIIATGAKALWIGLESEQRLRGRGVSACATCDGFFFRNKTVAVVGGGDTAMEDALTLTKFATKVYIIHRRGEFRASKIMQERVLNHEKIEVIWNSSVSEVLGEQKVEGIKLLSTNGQATERVIPLDGVFVAIGHKPDTDLFKDQIRFDEKNYIVTTSRAAWDYAKGQRTEAFDVSSYNLHFQTMTSVEGVFAAGDCVDYVYRQAATASGMGVAAALDMERWIVEKGK
jgi:thioredoxin reductase (NADPH)